MSFSIKESLLGKKGGYERADILTPEQQQLFGGLTSGLGGMNQQMLDVIKQMLGGNQQFLEQMQAPALRQFQEQTIPGLAERFAGAGAQSSSAFQQALGGAGAGLAENLAGQRAQLGMQSQQTGLQGILQALGIAQQPQFQQTYREGTAGGLWDFLGSLAGGLGGGLVGGLGGGLGKALGGR